MWCGCVGGCGGAQELLQAGLPNLQRHISSASKFGIPVIVAVNKFATDTQAEMELLTTAAKAVGHGLQLQSPWVIPTAAVS